MPLITTSSFQLAGLIFWNNLPLKFLTIANNRNRNLQTSKAPLESQAQGTSLFTSAASSQRGCPKGSPKEVRVRLPEGQRGRVAVKVGVV